MRVSLSIDERYASSVADEWSEAAIVALEEGGNRSSVRQAVVEKLAEQACAVTAAELSDQLARQDTHVGRATVYRVLERLRVLRLVQGLDVGPGGTRYEPARHATHHDHFVCDDCGDVTQITDAGLERAIHRLAEKAPFTVERHDVVLRGSCARCARGREN